MSFPLHAPVRRCWDNADQLCIVLEYAPKGALDGLLKTIQSQKASTWAEPFALIMLGIARCFKYLHHEVPGEALIHRDLKPANVLITDSLTAKVADFGKSFCCLCVSRVAI